MKIKVTYSFDLTVMKCFASTTIKGEYICRCGNTYQDAEKRLLKTLKRGVVYWTNTPEPKEIEI